MVSLRSWVAERGTQPGLWYDSWRKESLSPPHVVIALLPNIGILDHEPPLSVTYFVSYYLLPSQCLPQVRGVQPAPCGCVDPAAGLPCAVGGAGGGAVRGAGRPHRQRASQRCGPAAAEGAGLAAATQPSGVWDSVALQIFMISVVMSVVISAVIEGAGLAAGTQPSGVLQLCGHGVAVHVWL
jgi:hypothetical protein